MQLTIDISMYPNREDFIPPIDDFIERINRFTDLNVQTFPTSTVVVGEYHTAMNAVQQCIAETHEAFGMAVFVVKFIPNYQALPAQQ